VGKLKSETTKQERAVLAAQSHSDQNDTVSVSESGLKYFDENRALKGAWIRCEKR
jgi:hypothetical protein